MNRRGRTMADPTRARILMSLLEKLRYPAVPARDLDLTRSCVSNHLTCLRGCGIIAAAPEGRQTRYEIADPRLTRALSSLVDVVVAVDEGTPCIDDTCNDLPCCGSSSDRNHERAPARPRTDLHARSAATHSNHRRDHDHL